MDSPTRLRRLLAEPGLLVPPVVWDGLGARLAEAAGFPMIFQSGACVAAGRLGGPDLDYISMSEMAQSLEMIHAAAPNTLLLADGDYGLDRKSTRLNSSHLGISYAVFCLKKK